jgi:methyl-accepting chemotaxis protein
VKALNSLWVRLTLVFALIALVTLGTLGVLSNRLMSTEFRYYVVRSDVMVAGGVIDRLAAYYERNGSWKGIGTLLDQGVNLARASQSRFMPGVRTPRLDVILTDARGRVFYDVGDKMIGTRLSQRQLDDGMPIINANGETTGYLLIALPKPEALGVLERGYLTRFRNVLFAATGVAIALGVAASAVFSLNLTAPLRRLAGAARQVAKGDLSQRVS